MRDSWIDLDLVIYSSLLERFVASLTHLVRKEWVVLNASHGDRSFDGLDIF